MFDCLTQFDDAPVMAGDPLTARFPTVHPFTLRGEQSFLKYRLARLVTQQITEDESRVTSPISAAGITFGKALNIQSPILFTSISIGLFYCY